MELVCCVIASHNPIYDAYKQEWVRYLSNMRNLRKIVSTYFIYNDATCSKMKIHAHECYTDIYFPYEENIQPGILQKTLAFYEYSMNISFTHMLRTNLSSFFKFEELIHVLHGLDTKDLVLANCVNDAFPSGCGAVFSHDVIEKILTIYSKNQHLTTILECDDVIIGSVLRHLHIDITSYEYINFCEQSDEHVQQLMQISHFHYRTKPKSDKTSMKGVLWYRQLVDKYIESLQ